MYLVSKYAGYGRGLWFSVDDGSAVIKLKHQEIYLKVQHGQIIQQTTTVKDSSTTLKYGKECN